MKHKDTLLGTDYYVDGAIGTGTPGNSGDAGPANAASLYLPWGLAADSFGNIYVAENENSRVRRIDVSTGVITTFAGTGVRGYAGDGGFAQNACLNQPTDVAFDSFDNLYICDYFNHVVRMVAPHGIITTVAGNNTAGYNGDSIPAINASLNFPTSIAIDQSNNLLIVDQSNNRVRKVTRSSGLISTILGAGTATPLNGPDSICLDAAGSIYVSECDGHRVQKVSSSGTATVVAGTGVGGYNGDNIPAVTATLNYPTALAIDANHNLLIADGSNYRVRMVDSAGMISTVAGTGQATPASGNGGLAKNAAITPSGLLPLSDGSILVSDGANHQVRAVAIGTPPDFKGPMQVGGHVGGVFQFLVQVGGMPNPTLSQVGLPNGLALSQFTISGTPNVVVPDGQPYVDCPVTLAAKNALGTTSAQLLIRLWRPWP